MIPPSPRLARWLQRMSSRLLGRNAPGPPLDRYVVGLPSAQNAIDILPGWRRALPPHLGVRTGAVGLHDDARIRWAIAQAGPLQGRRILELGPQEAADTVLLEQQAPDVIHAIEADRTAYLRCLVVKELLDLKRARFLLGDAALWLQATETRYDLIVASDLLHRSQHPLRLLDLIAARCDAFYLWTRYFDAAAMPPGDPRREPFSDTVGVEPFHGVAVRLHRRKAPGGDPHCWIEKDALLDAIRALGFSDLRVAHDQPDHPDGPAVSIFASRAA